MAKTQKLADPSFPEETLLEIFSYLPIKSLGRSRCLSKTWNTQLSTTQFINLWKKRKPNQENILLITPNQPIHLATLPVKNGVIFSKEITQLGTSWVHLAGSSNGLVFLIGFTYYFDMAVINPITRQGVCIPESPYRKGHVSNTYSFAYDTCSDDYKVVLLCCKASKHYDRVTAYIDVYSLKTRVWNSINLGDGFEVRSKVVMACVNGAVHWFIGHHDIFGICAFDLATQVTREFSLPKGIDRKEEFDGLVVLRGCLAIVDCFNNGSTDVWVIMNEYGVRDSWVRFRIDVDVSLGREIMPLCFVGDAEMICSADRRIWFVYDLKAGMRKEMVGGEIPVCFNEWMVFEESLVAPNGSGKLMIKKSE